MKRILYIVFCIFFSVISLSSESIKNYDVDVNVEKNGVLDITEKITYTTDLSNKRGIYRIIPFKYSNASYFKLENRIGIKDFSAKYSTGEDTGVLKEIDSNVYSFRLGKEDVFLLPNQEYTYVIKYKVYNVVRTKDNVAQIYFNVIGQYWDMPIEKSSFTLRGIDGDLEVYSGKVGETRTDNIEILKENDGYKVNVAGKLDSNTGVTFLINSTSFNYTNYDRFLNVSNTYPLLIISPIVIFILLIINIAMSIFNYKQRIRKAVMVEYRPPKVEAIIAKKIMNQNKYTNLLIVIFQLMKKDLIIYKEKNPKHDDIGEYVIKLGEKVSKKKKKFDDYVEKVYCIDSEKVDEKYSELTELEKMVLSKLVLVKNDIFKNKKVLSELENKLLLETLKIYSNKYASSVIRYALYVLLLGISVILYAISNGVDVLGLLIIAIPMIITFLRALNIKKYTDLYKDTKLNILGFKKFLENAEVDEFKFFTDIDDIIRYFKDILPYALALGLENQYLRMLDGVIDMYSIDRDMIYNNVGYYYFINRNIYNQDIRQSVTNSNSYGGKSSFNGGFSSSGSSGGGFGGGGGSSW